MANHNQLGRAGEDAAVAYLEANGYYIRHRNWRKGRYELDIVAVTADEIVFIEVKTRGDLFYTDPQDAVNNRKIMHIVNAADAYIRQHQIDLPARFDIIAIVGQAPDFRIDHIVDAFYPPTISYRR